MSESNQRPVHPLAAGVCGCRLYLDSKVVEHRDGCPFPAAARLAEEWNAWFERRHLPVLGAPVRYWTGERTGPGVKGVTRTGAEVLGGHTAVLWVEGVPGAVALSHAANETPRFVDPHGGHWVVAGHDEFGRGWLRCEETDHGARTREAVEAEFGWLTQVGVDHG